MEKLTVRDVDLKGKRVLIRVDFNVPLKGESISDDTRILAALPTIQYALDQSASVVLMSHLGRPGGERVPALSLGPVARYLDDLLDADVLMAPDTVGDAVTSMVDALRPGQILVLENTRFHPEEEGKAGDREAQDAFARQLASYGDVYVNDAFGTAHRAHASTAVVNRHMDLCVAGFLMVKEIDYLGNAIESPERPFVAIIGGAKVSGKLEVLRSLMTKVDTILIGGGMAYTFLRAQGHNVGSSLVEAELVDTARDTLAAALRDGVTLMLPTDNVVADAFAADANTATVGVEIADDWMALDIGPETAAAYAAEIAAAKTVLWNGPMGCFEMAPFAAGTMRVCEAVANSEAVSVIGGGDSVSAVKSSGLADRMSHISTGGGASLEFLEGKMLPGVGALTDR